MNKETFWPAFRYGLSLWPFAVATLVGSLVSAWGGWNLLIVVKNGLHGPIAVALIELLWVLVPLFGGGIVAFAGCYGALYRMWQDMA